jgi:hypothetical protein
MESIRLLNSCIHKTNSATPDIASAMRQSVEEASKRITNVKYAKFAKNQKYEMIQFEFDGATFLSELKGRNRDLAIGFGINSDRLIAARTIIDGDSKQVR